jgi:hypothetical protein
MENGDDTHGWMDRLGARGEGGRRLIDLIFFLPSFFLSFVCCLHQSIFKGTHTPRFAQGIEKFLSVVTNERGSQSVS